MAYSRRECTSGLHEGGLFARRFIFSAADTLISAGTARARSIEIALSKGLRVPKHSQNSAVDRFSSRANWPSAAASNSLFSLRNDPLARLLRSRGGEEEYGQDHVSHDKPPPFGGRLP